jgi:ribosomal protein S18 acetylase RimI-like enzyme
MRFELDNTLIDDILFYMENQDGDFLLDTQKPCVIDINNNDYDEDTDYNDDRFISIPDWGPGDGYRLMEKFAANLKNPLIRKELSDALNRNKGVFRAFRDILEQYRETEKMWFAYKEKEMKKEIILWYNSLREEWGLEPIGSEPEDTTSLVFEDFVIKEQLADNSERSAVSFTAETADGDLAGLVKAKLDGSILCINVLEVKPEYRGMGLGKTLLSKLLEKADAQKLDVSIDLPCDAGYFARSLLLENFKPVTQRFIRHCDNTAAKIFHRFS